MKIIINHDLEENEIGLSSNILPDSDKGKLEIGCWKREVKIKRIDTDDLHIPLGFFPFSIPLALSYKWKEEGRTLKLGPVIAFLISGKKKDYTAIRKFKKYMEQYPKVNGLVFISTVSQIDIESETMKGYFYDPKKNGFDPVERTFPYPDAIFRRCVISNKKKYRSLRGKLNKRIFNWPILNKFKQYQTFLDKPEILSHFPKTKRLTSIKSVDRMVHGDTPIYIKPISSAKAKGIVTLTKRRKLYVVQEGKLKKELNRKQLRKFIRGLITKKKKYIVQQAIPSIENKNIVLRSIMQKNDENEWQFTGGYARIGSEGSVVTNRVYTKEFMTLEDCFKTYYGLNSKSAASLVQTLVATCKEVCKGFDEKGMIYGDLAFDIMVDKNLKVWVIEVNNRKHNHRSPLLTVRDRKLYRRLVSTPLLYAKYLSGF